jgi:hypothetical protein
MGNDNQNYHQSVSISPGQVVAQTFKGNDIDSLKLDLKTGRLQATGGEEQQCHRAHI